MNIYFPGWVSAVLTLVNVAIAALQSQHVPTDPTQVVIVNVVAAVVTAALALQRQTTNLVRRMRGKPTIA